MTSFVELVSDLPDLGYFNFNKVKEHISLKYLQAKGIPIEGTIKSQYIDFIARTLSELESFDNALIKLASSVAPSLEDSILSMLTFKIKILKFKFEVSRVKKSYETVLADIVLYERCENLLENVKLIENRISTYGEQPQEFAADDPLKSALMRIKHDLEDLQLKYLKNPINDIIFELNALQRHTDFPDINIITDNLESLTICSFKNTTI